MKAVVLAGGQEFGQCPLSRQLPRALWPLVDKPVIEHVLAALRGAGVGQMAISANGRTHAIADRVGYSPSPDVAVVYSEDAMPRGAAGCIKDCEKWLGEGTFIVAQGASIPLGVDFVALIDSHRRAGAALTVAALSEDEPGPDRNRLLNLTPAGLYVCESSVFPHIKPAGYQDMKEQLIPRLVESGLRVQALPLSGQVLSIRNEEAYINAMVQVLNDPSGRRPLVEHLGGELPGLWIDSSAYVHSQARVIGPAYIGPGARLHAEAVVIGPAVVGADCEIGADAVVHEAILWSGAKVGTGAMVEHSVVASGAAVLAGVEVRGSIVLDTGLTPAERESLSGSTDLTATEIRREGWWSRLWRGKGKQASGKD